MAMPKTHIAQRSKDGTIKGFRVIPYVRMLQSGQAIGIYNGQFVNDQGNTMDDSIVPAWAKDRVARMKPERRTRLGMDRFDKVPRAELSPQLEGPEEDDDPDGDPKEGPQEDDENEEAETED